MVLFVDETEDKEFFIVVGLLVESRQQADLAFQQFKNSIKGFRINKKDKARLYTEFKSVLLDRRYKRIKKKMLATICELNANIFYSIFQKSQSILKQQEKEDVYISLLEKIVLSIDTNICVIFDTFNKPIFEKRILDHICKCKNVQAIMSMDSQAEQGLQFVDNICSVIRLHESCMDIFNFYEIIKNNGIKKIA